MIDNDQQIAYGIKMEISNYIENIKDILSTYKLEGYYYKIDPSCVNIKQFQYVVDNVESLDDSTWLGFVGWKRHWYGIEYEQEINVTYGLIKQLFEGIKPLKPLWYGMKYFLDEVIEYRKLKPQIDCKVRFTNLEANVDYCLSSMHNTDKRYLHEPLCYNSDEAHFVPKLKRDFFVASDHSKIVALIEQLHCLGTYNNRVVLEFKTPNGKFDKYGTATYDSRFVGFDYDDLVEKFRIYDDLKTISKAKKKIIKQALINYCNLLDKSVKERIGVESSYTCDYIICDD